MRRLYLVPAVLLLVSTPTFAQNDLSKVEVKATRVSGNVYMLTGAGGNIGVSVGDDGIVIVDDQFAPLAPKIKAALASISDKPLRFVLNTHYHGDHTGSNAEFGKDATIVAHDNVRKRLESGTTAMGRQTPPAPHVALPVVTFDNTLTLHINGEDVRAVHFPNGHTDGDAVIYFSKSNVVHMADDFFNGTFPVVDLQNGGSVSGMADNVEKVLATLPDDVKVIPGHGPLGDKSSLKKFATMLRETRAVVAAEKKQGRTADDMKKAKVLANWDAWGAGFISTDRWIDTLYADVK